MNQKVLSNSPDETFEFARQLAGKLSGGEVVLFNGSLGAGKTLFTKGLLSGLGYDPDEVTSPSFALVNFYKAKFDVYHIDLWRLAEMGDAAFAVGLEEILENENAVVVVEWSERISGFDFRRSIIEIDLEGDGESTRSITVRSNEAMELPQVG